MFFKKFRGYFIFICILFLSISSYGACLDTPTFVKISSGSNLIGNFTPEYLNSMNSVYIKSDLNRYPLSVDFYFENIEDGCFRNGDDVRFKLLSTGIWNSANIKKDGEYTVAGFSFDISVTAPDSFDSIYAISNKDNVDAKQATIKFVVDDDNPLFINFENTPSVKLIKSNTTVSIDYEVSDDKVGLNSIIVGGANIDPIYFSEGEKTYSGSFSENLIASKSYKIIVKDKLSNEVFKDVNYIVDSDVPIFSDFNVLSYTRNEYGDRRANFEIRVTDMSYSIDSTEPVVRADFSSFTNVNTNKVGNCKKDKNNNESYVCVFYDVVINKIGTTTNVPITFSASDVLDNENSFEITTEIFYDSAGPEILDFYLINSKNEKNTFNAIDNDVSIVLEFKDDSVNDENDIRLLLRFDGVQTYVTPSCSNISLDKGTCIWKLGDTVAKYSGLKNEGLDLGVTIIDTYGNPTTRNINVTVDNSIPVIDDIQLVETDDIKDGIISSGEKFNFEIFIKDNNLKFDTDYIYGDFSRIDRSDSMNKKGASCIWENETTVKCVFEEITAVNGYLNETVHFYVQDISTNIATANYSLEVFAISDEVFSSYKIDPIMITNLLDRHKVKVSESNAWFEGNISFLNEENTGNVTLVSYELKGCNDSNMNPVLLGKREMYPTNRKVKMPEERTVDNNFIIKVEVKTHPNDPDLVAKNMSCTMSILKRDSNNVYPPELVKFKLQFDYFNLTTDNLLETQAKDILSMIDDAEKLGSWIDDVYEVYDVLNSACSVANTALGIMGNVAQLWYTGAHILSENPTTTPIEYKVSNTIIPGHGMLSDLVTDKNGFIGKACMFITCENGALLGKFWDGGKMDEFFSTANNLISFDSMCSDQITGYDATRGERPIE